MMVNVPDEFLQEPDFGDYEDFLEETEEVEEEEVEEIIKYYIG